MEALPRHRGVTAAVPIAGDGDLVPALGARRASGVRVHLWGVEPPFGTNQAERLAWEADTVEVLDRPFLEPYFTRQPVPADQPGPPAPGSPSAPPPAPPVGGPLPAPPPRPVPHAVAPL